MHKNFIHRHLCFSWCSTHESFMPVSAPEQCVQTAYCATLLTSTQSPGCSSASSAGSRGVERVKRRGRNARVRRGGAGGNVFANSPQVMTNDTPACAAQAPVARCSAAAFAKFTPCCRGWPPGVRPARCHGAQRRRRGIRVCIIAVVNDRAALRAHDARARLPDRLIGRNAADDLIIRQGRISMPTAAPSSAA